MMRAITFAAFLAMTTGPVMAQHDAHSGHVEQNDAAEHAGHDSHGSTDDMSQMDHSGHSMSTAPPSDARDPHAYSGGYDFRSDPRLHLGDEHAMGGLFVDRLEAVDSSDASWYVYDVKAWYGKDYDRLVLKAEGDVDDGKLDEASTELLWSHAVTSFWNSALGVRYDSGDGPDRSWLALGFDGLAPYWFEIDATFYIGEQSRTALAVEAEYELLLTQKLVLQPRFEAQFYGKSDPERELGSGLSDAAVGLRLRYEFIREFAPYIGVEWVGSFDGTADHLRDAGADTKETRTVAGFRFWF